MDYLDEDPQNPAVQGGVEDRESLSPDLELDVDEDVDADAAPRADVDPFLLELLPEDVNTRRRVVTALLRAVLAERKIT